MKQIFSGRLTSLRPVDGGWLGTIDDALPIGITRDQWPGPVAPAVGDEIRYRYEAPEFVGRGTGAR
jgi:hypothetical protein